MLNRALRLLEADIMVHMSFFLHDLHRQIQQMHAEQVNQYSGKPFVVYRGQGLPIADFEKLRGTEGGLISFNCFLSTSQDKKVSREFAQRALANNDNVGVLFTMTVDSKVTLMSFSQIQKQSAIPTEAEILFTMQPVFRIGSITEIDKSGRLFEVQLILTTDDDKHLRILTQRLDDEIDGYNGWDRIGRLLIRMGSLKKAEGLYTTLISQSSNDGEHAFCNHQLGYIKDRQAEYKEALIFYEKALEIWKKTLPANHPSLATSYGCIGDVYANIGEYSKALSSYETVLDMQKKTLPPDHPSLATSYNNRGKVYADMGEFSKALSSYETAVDIKKKTLPPDHPSLAISYSNIGSVYNRMGEYSKALSLYKIALELKKKTLPADHPSVAISYNNIGLVYDHMGEYSNALISYETALDMQKKTLPP